MQNPILCLGETAKTPYKIQKINVSVYTIEELMYVLGENVYIIDNTMLDRKLREWIGTECGLVELAEKLDRSFLEDDSQVSVSTFLVTLFEYTGFYDQATIDEINDYLLNSAKLSPEERVKNAADFMAKSGYYKSALKMYRQQSDRLGKNHELAPKLLHNMGWVYIKLFLYDRASDLFLESFYLSGDAESLIQAMAAKRLCLDELAYVEWVTKLKVDISEASEELERRFLSVSEEIEAIRENHNISGEPLETPESLEEKIEALKQDYRKVE